LAFVGGFLRWLVVAVPKQQPDILSWFFVWLFHTYDTYSYMYVCVGAFIPFATSNIIVCWAMLFYNNWWKINNKTNNIYTTTVIWMKKKIIIYILLKIKNIHLISLLLLISRINRTFFGSIFFYFIFWIYFVAYWVEPKHWREIIFFWNWT
jgi:hypothetical protein